MKIKFISTDEISKNFTEPPKPASSFIPEWYKSIPGLVGEEKKHGIHINNPGTSNSTIKGCSPFLDALVTGYIWSAPVDIEIRKEDNNYFFRWRTEGVFVTEHTYDQHPGVPPAFNGKDFIMKWAFNYIIETPKGYSTLFTHPLNRNDLPFKTFSGIVDTDEYNLPVQFPFQILKMEEDLLIIEKGTPLCQIIPFKRENWKSEKENISDLAKRINEFNFKSKIIKSYKKNFWKKKRYV